MTSPLHGFDPTLLLVLNLAGTFVFGLSGGLAGVQKRLDAFGVVVLAVVVGLAGGITRDVLIGIPPQTFRDWRYLAVAGGAGLVTFLAHPVLERLEGPILVLDAAGLALFCVTGASTALDHHVGTVEAVVLGAITGVGGGVLRDILIREIPVVLRTGLYAIPALIGAAVVVGAGKGGSHNLAFPLVGAAVCFLIRVAGIRFDLNVPRAPRPERD
ncbi:MAG TPA: TRIC cation channel family protein [Gaiellaceae bacterium]|nr:TRIC cation channel family protein [Gaiellaceae bacterium]